MKKIGIGLLALAIIGWMLKETFTQSGIEDLQGGFTEVASYRNENNTGPVQRIYAVTVKDTLQAQFEAYGDLMPHSKYGNTKVYYFLHGREVPKQLVPGDINFGIQFNKNCIALYEKSAMGNVGILKWPLR